VPNLARKSSSTTDFFKRIARKGWQKSDYFTYSSRYAVLRRWLASRLSTRQKHILSIGCGSGEMERDLSKLKREVTGLDISHDMLLAAARRGLKSLVLADAKFLPFGSAGFDLVMFPESIGYFDLNQILPEVARILKPGGRVLIVTYSLPLEAHSEYRKHSVADLVLQLSRSGFHVQERKLLHVNRNRVTEMFTEERPAVIYILARKQ
jgi:ubiquinone/menaquinone biosynthesis C-methylase UbiE